ncbi:MAG: hypothetical protein HQM12_06940 [SAR324 cluster bacterium]|nr:hypothetical protein [SAR324 cluster bacterium]
MVWWQLFPGRLRFSILLLCFFWGLGGLLFWNMSQWVDIAEKTHRTFIIILDSSVEEIRLRQFILELKAKGFGQISAMEQNNLNFQLSDELALETASESEKSMNLAIIFEFIPFTRDSSELLRLEKQLKEYHQIRYVTHAHDLWKKFQQWQNLLSWVLVVWFGAMYSLTLSQVLRVLGVEVQVHQQNIRLMQKSGEALWKIRGWFCLKNLGETWLMAVSALGLIYVIYLGWGTSPTVREFLPFTQSSVEFFAMEHILASIAVMVVSHVVCLSFMTSSIIK